jgi:hypothetical protein
MARFIIKKKISNRPLQQVNKQTVVYENKEEKKVKDMDTKEKITLANEILGQSTNDLTQIKKVRKDKGLIEKTESSKIILTEDNRELLND